MSFRLVRKSVTLNDLERRNGRFLRYFSEFGSFRAHCVCIPYGKLQIRLTATFTACHTEMRILSMAKTIEKINV